MTDRIYLDHAATTPMRPEAVAAVADGMARWANPSSPHAEGRAARRALEEARARIGAALGWQHHIILTSGASEALAIALGRAKGGRRFVSAVEHDAVFRAAPDAAVLPMAGQQVDRAALADAVSAEQRPVVAIQHANSETGTLQPIDELAALVRSHGGILISDCAQSAGRIPLPDADLLVVSAHKLGGPPGIGALLVRDLALLEATGGQESGYRGGTENLPAALGFAAALEVCDRDVPAAEAMSSLRETVADRGGLCIGNGSGVGHIAAIAMPGLSAAAQLVRFDALGFAVSAGSACASGSLKRSRALAAFGVPDAVADSVIRVSIGWSTTAADLHAFAAAWCALADEARTRAA